MQDNAMARTESNAGPRLVWSYREFVTMMEGWLRPKANTAGLRILEAGCGNQWPLQLEGVKYSLVGVDVDERALDVRRKAGRANETIQHGDLRNRALFPAASFDVIYNSFVLEHVEGAANVLENFTHWLRPGGLIILRIPDRNSVYGFLARKTPFWLHVLYKKHIEHVKNAGKPGFDPYPTVHDPVVSRRGIHQFCREHGLEIKDEAASANYLPQHSVLKPLMRAVVRTISALSLGKLDWRYNNLTYVIEKP